MANCYYFNFEVNAAFPAVCFFHAVKQIELFAKLLFGIYKYMFYRLRKFLLGKEATSHFPRNNLQHAQGRILTKRYRRLALIKIMISISWNLYEMLKMCKSSRHVSLTFWWQPLFGVLLCSRFYTTEIF